METERSIPPSVGHEEDCWSPCDWEFLQIDKSSSANKPCLARYNLVGAMTPSNSTVSISSYDGGTDGLSRKFSGPSIWDWHPKKGTCLFSKDDFTTLNYNTCPSLLPFPHLSPFIQAVQLLWWINLFNQVGYKASGNLIANLILFAHLTYHVI